MRVVITGATGAIGHALIAECIRQNMEVAAICHRGSAKADRLADEVSRMLYIDLMDKNLEHISWMDESEEITFKDMESYVNQKLHIYFMNLDEYAAFAGSVCPSGCEKLLDDVRKGAGYDLFFHLAWNGTTGSSRNDESLQQDNLRYALDAVELAHKLLCHTFIGAGSQAEYGRVEGRLSAETPAHPENEYGRAKLEAGIQTRALCKKLSIKHIWTRILSVYGPYDTATSMIMGAIAALKKGEVPQFTKGEQQWDYLYSADAAKAMLAAALHGRDGSIYPIGSGEVHPLAEYIEILRQQVAPEGTVALGAMPYAPKQVMYLCADISQLSEDTGFRPETKFAQGIQQMLKVQNLK